MKITKCSNGHFYDAEQSAQCPFCREANADAVNGIPARFAALGTVEKTGQGSTGSVYKISGEKTYALKEIVCGEDVAQYQNVLYEIAVMQALSGAAQTVQLYDCEEKTEGHSRTVYLLEEYLTPLTLFWSMQPPAVNDILRLAIQLCDGLIACRQAGVAQLDVQPKNLFVDANGNLKIGDFGASLFLSDLKRNRHMWGTLAYMAPEVYQRGICGEQSDIYSVGVLLYSLFNENRIPFAQNGEEELAIYKRLAGTPLPSIAYRDTQLSPKLDQVLKTACAYEMENRFQAFEDLRERLQLLYREAQECGIGSQGVFDTLPPESRKPVVPVPPAEEKPQTDPAIPKRPQKPVRKFCIICGAAIPAGGNFCVKCGASADDLQAGDFPLAAAPAAAPVPPMAATAPSPTASAPGPSMTAAAPPPAAAAPLPSMTAPPFTEPAAPPAGGSVDLKKVQFSAVAPKTFLKGDYTMIEIAMYEESFRHVVDELIAEAEAPVKETRSGIFKVAEGASVRIVLSSPDIEIEDNEEEQEWQGGYLNFSFPVMLPEDYKKRQILFSASVYINDLIATKLKFIAKCFSLFEQKVKVAREDVLSAFISYASQDRHRVAAIIQGMKKARPEMDIFFDVESLRSGDDWEKALYQEIEKRDILFLFWSQFARESKWVEAEWRYAMTNKGVECIEPVPIDPPGVCPPPAELSQKHFNDKLLYIINGNGNTV